MGLFGTVIGLIHGFDGSGERSAVMGIIAGEISEALVTTGLGPACRHPGGINWDRRKSQLTYIRTDLRRTVPDRIGGLRHSGILIFFLVAYAISWAAWFVIFARHLSFLAGSGFWLYLVAVLAPHISAVLCTTLAQGADGLRAFYRFVFRRVPWRWGLIALAVPPLVNLARDGIVLSLNLAHGPFFQHPPRTFATLVFGQLVVVLGEEPGWRGYALPRLVNQLGPRLGTLALGVLWALWHLPLFSIAGTAQHGTAFVPFAITLTAWSMVITLVVLRSQGSVIPGMLFHLSANVCDFTMWEPGEYLLALGPWLLVAALAGLRVETREPRGIREFVK